MVRAALLIFAMAACGDDTFAPPVLGYLADGGFRRVVGTPGAARILPPLPIDAELERAALAAGRHFGLVSLREGTSLHVLRFEMNSSSSDTAALTGSIEGTYPSFDAVVFSRSGSAAAVYSAACNCIQVINGLPAQPVVARRIEVAGVRAIAVNHDGSAIAYSDGTDTIASNGQRWPVPAVSLAFSPDGTSLALVDGSRKTLWVVRDFAGAAELHAITGAGDAFTDPGAVLFADPSTILVADGRAIRAVDAASRQIVSTDCPCKASLIEPMAVEHVFRISDAAHGAVWIYEKTEQAGRTFFVPFHGPESDR
jgi:hypothetical protein